VEIINKKMEITLLDNCHSDRYIGTILSLQGTCHSARHIDTALLCYLIFFDCSSRKNLADKCIKSKKDYN